MAQDLANNQRPPAQGIAQVVCSYSQPEGAPFHGEGVWFSKTVHLMSLLVLLVHGKGNVKLEKCDVAMSVFKLQGCLLKAS